ncbi:MAG: hypothetical protein ACO38Q_02620 [Aquiluna sp.]
MEKPHYNVVIATPGESYKAAYVDSLVKTLQWLDGEWMSYTLLNNYSSFVASAREMTATGTVSQNWETTEIGSGEFTYDNLFWIDSDICWEVEDFRKLLASNLDIVSGLYGVGGSGRVNAMRLDMGTPRSLDKIEFMLTDAPVEVDGVGFGFLRVKSGVFERIPRPWFEILKVPVAMRLVNLSEDYSFCKKAQESGFQIWIDPSVRVGHHKEVVFNVDW